MVSCEFLFDQPEASGPEPITVNIAAIQGVTAPVGGTPVKSIISNEQYSGTVSWEGKPTIFAANTAYIATIKLTVKSGYTLQGVRADFFTVAGALSRNDANSGVITARFAQTVSIAAIQGIVAPVAGEIPVESITENEQYSGTVTWSPGIPFYDKRFLANTEYTAIINLVAKFPYTMKGVAADFFTVAGATAANDAGYNITDYDRIIVTVRFPTTITVVNKAAIQLTVPVAGEISVTSITENEQYRGTVTWSPTVSFYDKKFSAYTDYTATITLTPKYGYILEGVADNFFTVAGATATNDADSGVVTATFPQTGAAVISINSIQGLTVPVGGRIPVAGIENEQYTGTVTWSPAVNGTFAPYTAYTATITLTAKYGYTLQGVEADSFMVAGAASVRNSANSGVVTAVFPQTGAAVVNIAAISGIAVPALGDTPVAGIIENEQYTGTVTWSPAVSGTFAALTAYTATITLTAKTNNTLQGVAANFFTVAGATSVRNAVNSGVVTAVFPQTGASIPVDRFVYYWVDEHGSLVTTSGSTTALLAGRTLTITAQNTGYIVRQWHLNGINTGLNGNTYSFSSKVPGNHTIGLFVEKDGNLYNTNIIITVIPANTVTFNINNGTGPTPTPQTVSSGSVITLPNGSGLTRSGYTFRGWNTNSSGTGTNYNAGSFYFPTGDITLYARWSNGTQASPFPLNDSIWTDGNITSVGSLWYSFNVTSGATYRLWWNDGHLTGGDRTKTLDVMVDALYSDGTPIFSGIDAAWASARSFTASQTGTVILKVYPFISGRTGSFAVVYSTSSTRP
jgi:uncharacterized repeat protein (TIGR02543 family)